MNKLTKRKVITQDPAARRAAYYRALEAKAKEEAAALQRAEKVRVELGASWVQAEQELYEKELKELKDLLDALDDLALKPQAHPFDNQDLERSHD